MLLNFMRNLIIIKKNFDFIDIFQWDHTYT